jgi:ubiquinone/menaquinone biosynthesis C-methylase UbiE
MKDIMSLISLTILNISKIYYYLKFNKIIKLPENKYNHLSNNFVMKYWDQRAEFYSKQYGYPTKMPLLEKIILSHRQDISNVLELGCGNARNLISLAKNFPKITFSGIEISQQMINSAKINISKLYNLNNINIIQEDLEKIDQFNLPKHDLVFSKSTFQHLNPQVLNDVIKKLFKKGTNRLYIEEMYVRGLDDGIAIKWPMFYDNLFFNHNYYSLLKKYADINFHKIKLNNMMICYAVKQKEI